MSLLSQFFPSGGGSKIHLELVAVSGGGASGVGCNPSPSPTSVCRTGGGGGGAAYQGRLSVEPGSTLPVTIGAGGAINPTSPCNGSRGGSTIVKYPEGSIRVVGGGGGMNQTGCGLDPTGSMHGGTGGGGGCATKPMAFSCCAFFLYNTPSSTTTANVGAIGRSMGRSVYAKGNLKTNLYKEVSPTSNLLQSDWNGPVSTPYGDGAFYGAPAVTMYMTDSPTTGGRMIAGSGGGGAGGQGFVAVGCMNEPTTGGGMAETAGPGIFTDISGTVEEFGKGGIDVFQPTIPSACVTAHSAANTGNGGSTNGGSAPESNSGGSGVVIIRYPTDFAAAPSAPGATLCTPVTPGYHTYRFNSSGSITLP